MAQKMNRLIPETLGVERKPFIWAQTCPPVHTIVSVYQPNTHLTEVLRSVWRLKGEDVEWRTDATSRVLRPNPRRHRGPVSSELQHYMIWDEPFRTQDAKSKRSRPVSQQENGEREGGKNKRPGRSLVGNRTQIQHICIGDFHWRAGSLSLSLCLSLIILTVNMSFHPPPHWIFPWMTVQCYTLRDICYYGKNKVYAIKNVIKNKINNKKYLYL